MRNVANEDYWCVSGELDLESYLNPLNIEEQKDIFLDRYHNGAEYNPIFRYPQLAFDANTVVQKLNGIKTKLNKEGNSYSSQYCSLIDRDIETIKRFEQRENKKEDGEYRAWLKSLFGEPDNELVEYAQSYLSSAIQETSETQNIDAVVAQSIFETELSKRNFNNWIFDLNSRAASVSINPVKKTISFNKNMLFSKREIHRLIAHEIDVHVQRNENGSLQPDKIFQYGFPDYLKTEEGLALVSENSQGFLSINDMKKYCSRAIAAKHSIYKSFFRVFKDICKHHSFDEAFSIVVRIKRGLSDTSTPGAYTKDHIYLAGFLELKDRPRALIAELFCGKVGIEDIENLRSNNLKNIEYRVPDWVLKLP